MCNNISLIFNSFIYIEGTGEKRWKYGNNLPVSVMIMKSLQEESYIIYGFSHRKYVFFSVAPAILFNGFEKEEDYYSVCSCLKYAQPHSEQHIVEFYK